MFPDALRGDVRAMHHRRLHTLLGIPEGATMLQRHEIIVAGLPAQLLLDLCVQGEISASVRDWIVSPGRLKGCVSEERRLTTEESDKFFRAVHIIALAQAIFGEHEKVLRWLSEPKERFAGEAPFSMLTTTPGVHMVEEMLLQVVEGIYT